MADYLDHSRRWQEHRTPTDKRGHWVGDVFHHGVNDPAACPECHPLTPADPHPHAWADLGTPGLHGSVCRLCGETQID